MSRRANHHTAAIVFPLSKGVGCHASQGRVLRTRQFISVGDKRSVAKRKLCSGAYDTRPVRSMVMLTVMSNSAVKLFSPVNEAEHLPAWDGIHD